MIITAVYLSFTEEQKKLFKRIVVTFNLKSKGLTQEEQKAAEHTEQDKYENHNTDQLLNK